MEAGVIAGSRATGQSTCKQLRILPERGKAVLERGDNALQGPGHDVQPKGQQHQEVEGGPEDGARSE